MTRIVAGTAGGRVLRVPDRGTRPTSDRVREALFSRLEHEGLLDGAVVWDLYAGSGALGIEAASRGARAVVLVEQARGAVQVCRRNVADIGLDGVRVVASTVQAFLDRAAGAPAEAVDLVLVDPPYELDEGELERALAALPAHLDPLALVVVERSVRSPEPTWPAELERVDERRYGETVLWWAEPRRPVPPVPTVAS